MSVESHTGSKTRTAKWIEGVKAGWPIALGYFPIGLAFGVLAEKAGLTPWEIALMSIFVYAGSAQFIAASMIAEGASIAAIVVTTFVINMRHILMSSSLAVYLNRAGRGFLTLFAYGVTDESFAINLSRFHKGPWPAQSALAVNHTANTTWFIATVLGGFSGQFIPPGAFGIDYALVAMFICLLMFQIRGLPYILTGIIAAAAAVGLALVIPGNIHVVVASLFAASAGLGIKRLMERRREAS